MPNIQCTVSGRSQARAAAAKASSKRRCTVSADCQGGLTLLPSNTAQCFHGRKTCVGWGAQGEAARRREGKMFLKPQSLHSAPKCAHVCFNRNSFLPFHSTSAEQNESSGSRGTFSQCFQALPRTPSQSQQAPEGNHSSTWYETTEAARGACPAPARRRACRTLWMIL